MMKTPETRSDFVPHAVDDPVVLSVVVPAFNEENGIEAAVRELQTVLDAMPVKTEIVVVNDGSTDKTGEAAARTTARVINQPENKGYGAALKAGIAAGHSEYVAIIDADLTYPAGKLGEMLDLAKTNDMVVGARKANMENVPLVRRPAKFVLNALANFLARRKIPDLNSGLRVFKRKSLVPFVPLLPDGFSFTTTITLCMMCSDLAVAYLPIEYGKRVGKSKIRPTDFFRFILLLVRITTFFAPLRVFMPAGTVLFALGVLKLIYDIFLWNLSESAVFALLAAIMIWSLGLIADMVSRLHLHPHSD